MSEMDESNLTKLRILLAEALLSKEFKESISYMDLFSNHVLRIHVYENTQFKDYDYETVDKGEISCFYSWKFFTSYQEAQASIASEIEEIEKVNSEKRFSFKSLHGIDIPLSESDYCWIAHELIRFGQNGGFDEILQYLEYLNAYDNLEYEYDESNIFGRFLGLSFLIDEVKILSFDCMMESTFRQLLLVGNSNVNSIYDELFFESRIEKSEKFNRFEDWVKSHDITTEVWYDNLCKNSKTVLSNLPELKSVFWSKLDKIKSDSTVDFSELPLPLFKAIEFEIEILIGKYKEVLRKKASLYLQKETKDWNKPYFQRLKSLLQKIERDFDPCSLTNKEFQLIMREIVYDPTTRKIRDYSFFEENKNKRLEEDIDIFETYDSIRRYRNDSTHANIVQFRKFLTHYKYIVDFLELLVFLR